MTQEEKQLLLKDLCARLPHKVKIYLKQAGGVQQEYFGIQLIPEYIYAIGTSIVKPYLRPMSSMTEEEKKIMRSCGFELIHYDTGYTGFANIESCIDEVSFRFMDEFLSAHHFDYRGLIEKGLALEAPEDMYE